MIFKQCYISTTHIHFPIWICYSTSLKNHDNESYRRKLTANNHLNINLAYWGNCWCCMMKVYCKQRLFYINLTNWGTIAVVVWSISIIQAVIIIPWINQVVPPNSKYRLASPRLCVLPVEVHAAVSIKFRNKQRAMTRYKPHLLRYCRSCIVQAQSTPR